jgi:flagellar protein FliT
MLPMPTSQISLYEEMNALSSRMAEAARAKDWETLNRLARTVAALRDSLPDNDTRLSDADMQRKAVLIQRILDDDAEIRRHTEPWMEPVCRFLGQDNRQRPPSRRAQPSC